ncbi:branched-chain amino acid ABC transporter permease [Microbacterium luticocti]|uniref:branched-chain amino acid ABC transporter permease n=1 Tax=Microbacterium luticocti TaxID=451764 RepID=UPI0009FBCF0F|nr:branched-chain amino acid ABC transporter permease [Microbacterium luticocti]
MAQQTPGATAGTAVHAAPAVVTQVAAATDASRAATITHRAPTDENAPKTDFYFAGSIKFDDKPLEGVVVKISGNGFESETKTDANGRWKLYVPEKAKYTLTVDESTLPKGVIVAGESASQEVEFGLTSTKIVNLFLGKGERVTESIWAQLLSRGVQGLNFGLLLGLASMGAALIYGTTKLANFAHAEMVTWGGLVAFMATGMWGLPLWLGLVLAVGGGGLLGLGMDAGLWRPLRHKGLGTVQVMIVSIGLSLALRYFFQFLVGGGTMQLPGASPEPLHFGPISLSYIDLISMGVSLVAILAVAYFLTRTRIGKATRAISDNPQLAAASGIDVDGVIRIVWVLAGVLAATSGILWAYYRPGVKWDMGVQMLLLIFSAMTLGGLGTAFGALVGSIIVGVAIEVSTLWIPSDLKYASALIVLIIILLVRPQGLLGRRERLG